MTPLNDQPNDRRNKQRFPLQRELRYKLVDPGISAVGGSGHSIDISSSGLAFTTDRVLPADATVEVSMSWPVTLEDTCLLRLVVRGRVVRSEGSAAACTIDKFEFLTQSHTSNT